MKKKYIKLGILCCMPIGSYFKSMGKGKCERCGKENYLGEVRKQDDERGK